MKKTLLRRIFNRLLNVVARFAPGASSFRPFLHRLRGVTIKSGVFIGDDVYIDNEFPEFIEMHENASIMMRALIVAHTRGPGRIILEKNSFVGPCAVICCYEGRTIRIGEGAVVSAGSIVMHSVPARTMVAPPPTRAIAGVSVPLLPTTSINDFLAGMTPLANRLTGNKK